MRDFDYSDASDFLSQFFGETTEHAVEVRALPNDRGAGRAAPLFTRDPPLVEDHCRTWDKLGRAVYFGIATRITGNPTGTRADIAELPALWVDIDADKHGLDKAEIVRTLRAMPLPPSCFIDSGGGLHCYWLLRESINVRQDTDGWQEREDTIVAALRQLAGACGGDIAVCDLARVMRLPGTHNTKTGELRLASVLEASWTRHEFDDLVDMLDWLRPLVSLPAPPKGHWEEKPSDPFSAYAEQAGIRIPVDVQQRLAAMSYLADGDAGIHQTQLHISASMVATGEDDDTIVEMLLAATRAAAGLAGENWNWKREDRNIRAMIASARAKFAVAPKVDRQIVDQDARSTAATEPVKTAVGGGSVVDLAEQRQARQKTKSSKSKDDDPLIPKIGNMVVNYWVDNRGPLISVAGDLATYNSNLGYWLLFDQSLAHALRVTIQEAVGSLKLEPTTSRLNSIHRYIVEHPALHREKVSWNATGLIICRNGAVNPQTGEVAARSPDLYATWGIDVDYDPSAACPKFLKFLADALEGIALNEARQAISTVQEHMGASLVGGKPRDLRKAILFIGKSHTGKSRIANVYRALKGGADRCVGLKAGDLDDQFGLSPFLTASAWIADDAVRQNGKIDAERFKVIVTGEPLSIRIAGGKYIETALDIPVVWTANNLPRIQDDSEAVYNRSLIFPMNRVWPEGAGLDERGREIDQVIIEDELAGVLNFAISGWKSLNARGKYDPPDCMTRALAEYKDSNNFVAAWMAIAIEKSPNHKVAREDLRASYNGWYAVEYGAEAKVVGSFKLFSAMRRLMPEVEEDKNDTTRCLCGVRLTQAGIATFKAFANLNFGKTVGSGRTEDGLNQPHKVKPTGKEARF